MRAYTIVVDESLDQELPGDMPPFPGVVVEGGSPEGCVEQGREAIVLYLADLARADPARAGHEPAGGTGAKDEADGAAGLADEQAVDALRRAGAALDTLQAELLAELVRRQDPASQADLRRVHVALLRARTALTDADPDQPADARRVADGTSAHSR
jgi:predicted RNase H-like HicB family nuclease